MQPCSQRGPHRRREAASSEEHVLGAAGSKEQTSVDKEARDDQEYDHRGELVAADTAASGRPRLG